MQLASLALPPHPFVLARIEDAPPMQQEKAAAAGARPITLVQLSDRLGGHSEQMCIAFQNLLVRGDPVRQESQGEDRKSDVSGKEGSVGVDPGGRRIFKKKKKKRT